MNQKTRNTTIAGVFMLAVLLIGFVGFSDALFSSADLAAEKTQDSSELAVKNITQTASASSHCPGYSRSFGSGSTCHRSGSTTFTVVLSSSGSVNAQCDVSPSSTTVGSDVTYDASASAASSSIVAYGWDFGDGSSATTTSATTNHSYSATSTYTGSVTVVSANGNSDTASCPSVTVTEANSCPNVSDDDYGIEPGETLNGDVSDNDSDTDSDSLTYSLAPGGGPSDGTLNLDSDGTFTYNHDGGSTSTDSFTYEVDDGSCTEQGTAEITVNNNKPVAVIEDDPDSIDYCQSGTFVGSGSYDQDEGGDSIEHYYWSPTSRLAPPTDGPNQDTVDTSRVTWTGSTNVGLVVEDNEGANSDKTNETFTVDEPGYNADIIIPSDTPKRLWMTASSTNRSTKATIEVTNITGNSEFSENYSWNDLRLTFPETSGIPTGSTGIIESTSTKPTASEPGKFTFWIDPDDEEDELAFGTYNITAAVELPLIGNSCVYDEETVEIDLRAQTTAEF